MFHWFSKHLVRIYDGPRKMFGLFLRLVINSSSGCVQLVNTIASIIYRYQLLRVTPETKEQLVYLIQLSQSADKLTLPTGLKVLDFWRDPSSLGQSVDILTDNGRLLDQELESKGMPSSLLMDDVQR